ncbi:hypothetical protein [Gluconobacter oxydans]|uniref:hypothetical protein n=1 Tax=Gluconobacter oxydans TaxID=442 RepID=UPI0039ED926F
MDSIMLTYQSRLDGLIAVTIDSNVWNLLFDLKLDLAAELPSGRFKLFIPREVEIELAAIPERTDKQALKYYIRTQIAAARVQTQWVFGFALDGDGPQRCGGFDIGTWQSETERKFYDLIRERYLLGKTATNSQLTRNEGDAALGANSFSSVVLTLDLKPGPLTVAQENGGKILDMRPFREAGIGLASYVIAYYDASQMSNDQ